VDDHGHAHEEHAPGHGQDHDDHGHDHAPAGGVRRLLGLEAPHSHDAADRVDRALETSADGMRALKWSLVGLGVTALIQAVVVVASGSVALLGDTLHNVADALTAVPLGIAFTLGRRPRNRRYTYGYGRAEDVAGLAILVAIVASAAVAGYESVLRLLHPHPVHHLGVVMAAGVIGFAGNEAVAQYRIRVGHRIGSAALVADGLHARTDGLTSLAVVVGAIGVAGGIDRADSIIGLVITVAILVVLRTAARDVFRRLMDAVDPDLVGHIEDVLRSVDGVEDVADVRLRWIGHRLRAEVEIDVPDDLTVVAAHATAHLAHEALLERVPKLASAIVHYSPVSATP
jgi:cation diffusion facilitator family transporter